jgi:hypothetical protein
MTRPLFISKPENYNLNISEGAALRAEPALLSGYDGRENGVVIRGGHRVKFVITTAQALRLANEIADAVEVVERAAA